MLSGPPTPHCICTCGHSLSWHSIHGTEYCLLAGCDCSAYLDDRQSNPREVTTLSEFLCTCGHVEAVHNPASGGSACRRCTCKQFHSHGDPPLPPGTTIEAFLQHGVKEVVLIPATPELMALSYRGTVVTFNGIGLLLERNPAPGGRFMLIPWASIQEIVEGE